MWGNSEKPRLGGFGVKMTPSNLMELISSGVIVKSPNKIVCNSGCYGSLLSGGIRDLSVRAVLGQTLPQKGSSLGDIRRFIARSISAESRVLSALSRGGMDFCAK